jgi:hypothetical protein
MHHGDIVCLDFASPQKQLVVDVTVTSARTNSSVPEEGVPLPLIGCFAVGAPHAIKLCDYQ